ncbi:MAG TPA: DUF5777 family beta-barrel protein [Chryseosolibacter sp.]|nr:DUF5777 family beta-barrel protein [Chryseosolibacter sp.]
MMNTKLTFHTVHLRILVAILLFGGVANAQEDSLDIVEPIGRPHKKIIIDTFKGTRLVNGHSAETKKQGELELIFGHRFGRLNSGRFNLWGLDESYLRMGFDYGITDRLDVGAGRNSYSKIYDVYLKYKWISQGQDGEGSPFTITAFTSVGIQTFPRKSDDPTLSFFDRATYTYQLLIARKMNPDFLLQVSPALLHTNRVDEELYNHDQVAIGVGGLYRITDHLGVNFEYYYRIDPKTPGLNYNSLGIGFNIVTAGHVFQIILSNTQGMTERTFINQTAGQFFKGDIHLGFNITRTFKL